MSCSECDECPPFSIPTYASREMLPSSASLGDWSQTLDKGAAYRWAGASIGWVPYAEFGWLTGYTSWSLANIPGDGSPISPAWVNNGHATTTSDPSGFLVESLDPVDEGYLTIATGGPVLARGLVLPIGESAAGSGTGIYGVAQLYDASEDLALGVSFGVPGPLAAMAVGVDSLVALGALEPAPPTERYTEIYARGSLVRIYVEGAPIPVSMDISLAPASPVFDVFRIGGGTLRLREFTVHYQ